MDGAAEQKKSHRRAAYLWRLAHTYATSNPPLAQFYMSEFRRLACARDIDITGVANQRFCSHCSALFIPSLNCKVRLRSIEQCSKTVKCEFERKKKEGQSKNTTVVTSGGLFSAPIASPSKGWVNVSTADDQANPKKRKRKHTSGKNTLAYHCNVCEHVTYFEGTPPGLISRKEEEMKASLSVGAQAGGSTPQQQGKNKKSKTTPGSSERRRVPAGAKKKNTLKAMLAQSQHAAKANAAPSALSLYSFLESLK